MSRPHQRLWTGYGVRGNSPQLLPDSSHLVWDSRHLTGDSPHLSLELLSLAVSAPSKAMNLNKLDYS
jgi:hypothetical protein